VDGVSPEALSAADASVLTARSTERAIFLTENFNRQTRMQTAEQTEIQTAPAAVQVREVAGSPAVAAVNSRATSSIPNALPRSLRPSVATGRASSAMKS
jgi:hypothetical protein